MEQYNEASNPVKEDLGETVEKVDVAETHRAQRYAIGLIVTAIVFIIAMILILGTPTKVKPTRAQTLSNGLSSANAELQMNLEKLKQEQQQLQQKMTVARKQVRRWQLEGNSKGNNSLTQPQLIRMAAPSTVFESNGPVIDDENGTTHSSPLLAGQDASSRFANSTTTTSTVIATQMPHPDSTIASGEFIHAVLETAINSTIPGMVRAIVTYPVYAYEGERPLIPAGSRLIGQYKAQVLQGQARIMIIWDRIILPNGTSIQVDSPGTDAMGMAGQAADSIDTHFFSRFGQATLLSLIGAGVSNLGVSPNNGYNSASDYRMAIASNFQQSAQQSVQAQSQTGPTLHIDQGANINVFVAHDLSFYGVLGQTHV